MPVAADAPHYTEKALARLVVTDRKCDGCGTHIGRFTDKCHYDATFDQVYCSTNGCATRFTKAPFCTGCGSMLNPFQTEGVTEIPTAHGVNRYCAACSVGDSLEPEEKPKATGLARTPIAPRGVTPPVLKLAPLVTIPTAKKEDAPTASELEDAALGPWRVTDSGPNWYKVIHEVSGMVRSALSDKNRAIKKAAQFNRAV